MLYGIGTVPVTGSSMIVRFAEHQILCSPCCLNCRFLIFCRIHSSGCCALVSSFAAVSPDPVSPFLIRRCSVYRLRVLSFCIPILILPVYSEPSLHLLLGFPTASSFTPLPFPAPVPDCFPHHLPDPVRHTFRLHLPPLPPSSCSVVPVLSSPVAMPSLPVSPDLPYRFCILLPGQALRLQSSFASAAYDHADSQLVSFRVLTTSADIF